MPNRTICSVLEAMRKANDSRNYSYLLGLIEEAQNLANRMEAALWDKKDYLSLLDDIKKLKKERTELERQIKKLKTKVSKHESK